MTSIDQDPHKQHRPSSAETPTETTPVVPNVAQQPEAFRRTSLGEVAGRRFPTDADHPDFPDPRYPGIIPPDVAANPDNAAAREVIPTDAKKGWGRYVAIGAAGITALGVGGWVFGFGKTHGEMTALNSELGADKLTSAAPFPGTNPTDVNPGRIESTITPETVTLDDASADQFYDDKYFTDEQRAEWANEQLQAPSTDPEYPNMSVEQAAYQRLQAKLAREGRPALGPLVAPSLENTANEASVLQIVAFAAGYYDSDSNKGEKIIAAGMDNSHEMSESMRTDVRNKHLLSDSDRLDGSLEVTFTPNDAEKTQLAGHNVEMASPYSTDSLIGNIAPVNGAPTRVVYLRDSQESSQKTEEVQAFIGGRWTACESILPSEVGRWIPPKDLVDILVK